jgi:phage tail tape-measure protein
MSYFFIIAQNQYQEERLEREMGYDEKVAHGIATGIAGVTGMIAGAKLGATLGSFAGPVGALIGAAAGVAIGGVVTAVTNEAKEDSIVDKAVALTRETGSTKWMDDEDALARSGLSER